MQMNKKVSQIGNDLTGYNNTNTNNNYNNNHIIIMNNTPGRAQ